MSIGYMSPVNAVRVVSNAAAFSVRAAALLARSIEKRCGAKTVSEGWELTIELALDAILGSESYLIESAEPRAIRVVGGDGLGLTFGVGKLLHTSRYDQTGFSASAWRGYSSPQAGFRAIYVATHFMNFYEAAPWDDVRCYIDELTLWGANTVIVTFPIWSFFGWHDPAGQANLRRLVGVLGAAKQAGIKIGVLVEQNQGFSSAPPSIRAAKVPDEEGRRGDLGVNCCPSHPEGRAYLLRIHAELFSCLGDLTLDYLILWPYDEGGCGCEDCRPWGSRGFLSISRAMVDLARQTHPEIKAILSTWCFDTPTAGEWAGLARRLKQEPGWLDCIMADSHEEFPRYPLKVGVPGGLPLVSFPEISMWGRSWGGSGANPLPKRFERLWRQIAGTVDGGMPYSEGIYEDINKVICLQFYWDRQRSATDTLREYLACEFSPDHVDVLLKVIDLFEENWLDAGSGSLEALELVRQVNRSLSLRARTAWRWRIVYLRALIDAEHYSQGGLLSRTVLKAAYDELTEIYHADHADFRVKPPGSLASIEISRSCK